MNNTEREEAPHSVMISSGQVGRWEGGGGTSGNIDIIETDIMRNSKDYVVFIAGTKCGLLLTTFDIIEERLTE